MMRLRYAKVTVALFLLAVSCFGASAAVLYVNRAATGFADGTSWADAFTKIGDATAIATAGDKIWVAAGTYVENVQLPSDVGLYGGFAGTEAALAERNPAVNFTSIDAGKAGTAVKFATPAGAQTVLDGFRIRNGLPDAFGGGGAYIDGGAPMILNNVFSENSATQGAGIIVRNATPTIANNLFHDNTAHDGAAINIYQNNPAVLTIVNNTIVNNHSGDGGFVIGMASNGNVHFVNNLVANNDRQIYLAYLDTTATYENNDVWNNSFYNYFGPDPTGTAGNISVDPMFQDPTHGNWRLAPGSPGIDTGTNAAVVGSMDMDNLARIQDAGIDIGAYENSGSAHHLVFQTLPGNSAGYALLTQQPVLQIEDNAGQPVSGYSGPVTLSIDPGSGNPAATLSGTITVNAVDGVATFTDLSIGGIGKGFVLDAKTTDTLPEQSPMFDITGVRKYVSKAGLDSNDGLTWATAKLTVQAAINAFGEEVWVAAGTYKENITASYGVALYGGFAGSETDLVSRNIAANPAILDGDHKGSVLTSTGSTVGVSVRTIDGFTIQNGLNASGPGGGLNLPFFEGTIANCLITGNSASTNGGGVFIENIGDTTPVKMALSTNAITGNSAGQGGGIYLDVSHKQWNIPVDVSQTNSVISNNAAGTGGGAYFLGYQTLTQCTFDGNSAWIGGGVYQTETLVANSCEFKNNGITGSSADVMGGAVFSGDNSGLQAYGCTFTGNHVGAIAGKSANGGVWATVNNGSIYTADSTMTGNSAGLGGALYAKHGGNLTFFRCMLTGNTASANGGALWVAQGPLSMECSLLAGNTAGGYGGAIALDTAPVAHDAANTVYLLNNTIAANTAPLGGGGLDFRHNCDSLLLNNIVAFNDSGIQQDSTSTTAFYNNDVYGNGTGKDFTGVANPTGTWGNISADPLFVNKATGDYHLAAGSPAVDNGDTGPFNYDRWDIEQHARVLGARVDMGAYERAGAPGVFLWYDTNVSGGPAPGPLATQPVVRVIDSVGATMTGYSGSVTIALKPGFGTTTATLGGTATIPVVSGVATFTDLTVDKGGTGYYLTASISGHGGYDSVPFIMTTPVVRVSLTGSDNNDGSSWATPKRYIQSAMDQATTGGDVWIKAGHYVGSQGLNRNLNVLGGFAGTETLVTQRNPKANVVTIDALGLGSAFFVSVPTTDTPIIDGLTFTNGTGYGGGIVINSGAPTISNNTFTGNVTVFGGGILAFSSATRITGNRFIGNSATYGGGAIYMRSATATIDNNLFVGNSNEFQDGSAITVSDGSATIVNNTIVGNVGIGGAVSMQNVPSIVVNNIVAFNGSGVALSYGNTATVTEHHNLVYNNTSFNYQSIPVGAGDINADPLFVNRLGGDYRLAGSSPAINAGDDSVVSAGTLDLAGAARIQGSHVDMGAYETALSLLGVADVGRALRIAGGLLSATNPDLARLNVENTTTSTNKIDLRDAGRLMRKVAGLEANP